ncbi:unnamed protein product [Durusdinium trenchii]|uniref:Uncharacterized protein n=1 Tax=Durusdinium trenchii TaxID=1381693 RepID=A0ABP0NMT3_9DINO
MALVTGFSTRLVAFGARQRGRVNWHVWKFVQSWILPGGLGAARCTWMFGLEKWDIHHSGCAGAWPWRFCGVIGTTSQGGTVGEAVRREEGCSSRKRRSRAARKRRSHLRCHRRSRVARGVAYSRCTSSLT